MRHWSAPFIGLPYRDKGRSRAGVDCWGVPCLVYREHLGVADFPSYADRYASDSEKREISAVVAGEAESPIWRPLPGRLLPREVELEPFDILFFRRGRFDSHAGVVIDGRNMLHMSTEALASTVERFDTGRWPGTFAGAYRWRGLEGR